VDTQTFIILIIIGIVAGLLSGLVGIGGGIVIVPALVYFLGISHKTAQGSTLLLLMLPVGILAVMNYYKAGYVNWRYALIIAMGFVIGGFFGSKISLSIDEARLKKVFAIIILIVSIKMLFFEPAKKESITTEKQEK